MGRHNNEKKNNFKIKLFNNRCLMIFFEYVRCRIVLGCIK